MSKRQIENLLILNVPLIIINILAFSEGFFGLRFIGRGTIEQTTFLTLMIVSVVLVVYGNYRILFCNSKIKYTDFKKLKTPSDFINILENYTNYSNVSKSVNLSITQLKELKVRIDTLQSTLLIFFSEEEMTYKEFFFVINSSEKIFYSNIEKILNRINFLNSNEVSKPKKATIDEKEAEVLKDIELKVKQNADILNELYNLNYELCKLDSKNDIENSSILEQLKKITENVRLYD